MNILEQLAAAAEERVMQRKKRVPAEAVQAQTVVPAEQTETVLQRISD